MLSLWRTMTGIVVQRLKMADDCVTHLLADRRVGFAISNEFDEFRESQYGDSRLEKLKSDLGIHKDQQRVNVRNLRPLLFK